MATKRPAPHVDPSRRDQVPEEPRRKRQKPDNITGKSFKKAHTVNDIKSQIRSLKRLLEHNEGLPATIRVEKERALQSAQHELVETQKAKQRSDMIAKYHKIRFFDRQKATKRLKRAKKELQQCPEDEDEEVMVGLRRKVEDAEVDVNYAQFYPLDIPYVALFPTRRKDGANGDEDGAVEDGSGEIERKGDAQMWAKVRQCMADKSLDALRNGRLTQRQESKDVTKVTPHVGKKKAATEAGGRSNVSKAGKAKETAPDSDGESDGGFFE